MPDDLKPISIVRIVSNGNVPTLGSVKCYDAETGRPIYIRGFTIHGNWNHNEGELEASITLACQLDIVVPAKTEG